MNSIRFENANFTINDQCLKSGSIALQNSMIAESLEADVMSLRMLDSAYAFVPFVPTDAESFETSEGKTFCVEEPIGKVPTDDLAYGDAVNYYKDGNFVGKFYFRQYRRIPTDEIVIECLSAMGMLAFVEHRGGIYTGQTVEQIVEGYTDGGGNWVPGIIPTTDDTHQTLVFPCTIDSDVAAVPVYGWLPIASARDNLVQVMFQCGASVLKSENGELHIGYNSPSQVALEIPNEAVMLTGRGINYLTPATSVSIIEHSYTASQEAREEVLFDNRGSSAASHAYIQFSGPFHSLKSSQSEVDGVLVDDLDIEESGANFAVVTGTGYITGKPYVHTQRKMTKATGVTGEGNEKTVSDCTLISTLNVNNTLERVKAYYSIAVADSFDLDIDSDRVRPGMFISYPDPNDPSNTKQGYVMTVDYDISNHLTAHVQVATEWKPNHLGNSFDTSIVITADDLDENGYWNVPSEYQGKPARFILFSGGSGGYGSYDGEAGGQTDWASNGIYSSKEDGTKFHYMDAVVYARGGNGGAPGAGGTPGYKSEFSVDSLGDKYKVVLGAGGDGGGANGGTDPTDGGATSVIDAITDPDNPATHTSEDGQTTKFSGNYIDLITGAIYAKPGTDGVQGGNGGGAGQYETTETPHNIGGSYPKAYWQEHPVEGEEGDSIKESSQRGGTPGGYVYFDSEISTGWYQREGFGSGGGGASYDNPGTNASAVTATSYSSNGNEYISTPGNGGDAAQPSDETYGNGGRGGNGGGGSGAKGLYLWMKHKLINDEWVVMIKGRSFPSNGTPGSGADGGKGGDGFVLVYTSS